MHVRATCLIVVVVLAPACGAQAPSAAALVPTVSDGSVGPGSDGAVEAADDSGAPEDAGSNGGPSFPCTSHEAGADAAGGATAPSCPKAAQWSPGDSKTISIDFGDAEARSYDVYVGTSVQVGAAVPLLVNMHGLTDTPAIQAQYSQMNPVADANGFVVVYPAGLNASFNAGNCCGESALTGVDDVGFVRAIVADAESKICINPKRVYETGFSNGGMMAYELACNAADIFAAVAPTEGANETNSPCNPSRPVPLAAFESLGDPVIIPAVAQQSVQGWATEVGCTDSSPAQTMEAAFSCQEWSQCAGGALVWYCTLPGGTHYPPAGSAPVIWSSWAYEYREAREALDALACGPQASVAARDVAALRLERGPERHPGNGAIPVRFHGTGGHPQRARAARASAQFGWRRLCIARGASRPPTRIARSGRPLGVA